MTKAADDLFPHHNDEPRRVGPGQLHTTGILPSHGIATLIREKEIWGGHEIDPSQLQPASLDLRLGATAYRLRASFLPGPECGVMERVEELMLHKIDLSEGAVLETGCVYLVPLVEALALSERTSASANPKSSTGRLDVFTRLITDFCNEFDQVAAGYKGHLYLEISPRTFPILVRPGSRLAEMKRLHEELRLVDGEADIDGGIALTVNLRTEAEDEIVGYRAKRHSGVIDVDKVNAYDVRDFWDPVRVRPGKGLILDPDEFYILASAEALHIPATHAGEMVPYNPLVGEFRVHYAGFFDPGFGAREAGGAGSRIVLEVRSHDVPFILEHGQIIGRFVLERLTDRPSVLYGSGLGSNYQRQGLKLSKHFRAG